MGKIRLHLSKPTLLSRPPRNIAGGHPTWFLVPLVIFILIISSANCAYQPYRDTDPDYATSVHHLKSLVLVELYLLPFVLTAFTNEQQAENHNVMNLYIKDFTESNLSPLSGTISFEQFVTLLNASYINTGNFADDLVKHPLRSYRTIRRFTKYIKRFEDISQKDLTGALAAVLELVKLPKEEDVEAAMQSILRLRQLFRPTIEDLRHGRLEGLDTQSGLSLINLVEIADHAKSLKMYTSAIDMYDWSIKKCEEKRKDELYECYTLLNLNRVRRSLKETMEEHDDLVTRMLSNFRGPDESITPPDSSPFIFGGPLEGVDSENFAERVPLDIDDDLEALLEMSGISDRDKNLGASPFLFEKLCRGEPIELAKEPPKSSLYCQYVTHTHPAYLLGPLKVEVHNEDPHVVQIYDVISDHEIKGLQEEVQQEMRQSRTATLEGNNTGATSRYRTSANAWIEDNDHPKFNYLNRRISQITGLVTTGYFSTEFVQIAAYNPGGHYTPHSDAIFEETLLSRLPETEFQRGDRFVTFMIYLSDVEKGGGTGFPTLRRIIRPAKGSAVMWFNLNSDGTINYDVLHGGCPVLYGTKWITNKWIRSNDQMFIKPCSKDGSAWRL